MIGRGGLLPPQQSRPECDGRALDHLKVSEKISNRFSASPHSGDWQRLAAAATLATMARREGQWLGAAGLPTALLSNGLGRYDQALFGAASDTYRDQIYGANWRADELWLPKLSSNSRNRYQRGGLASFGARW